MGGRKQKMAQKKKNVTRRQRKESTTSKQNKSAAIRVASVKARFVTCSRGFPNIIKEGAAKGVETERGSPLARSERMLLPAPRQRCGYRCIFSFALFFFFSAFFHQYDSLPTWKRTGVPFFVLVLGLRSSFSHRIT